MLTTYLPFPIVVIMVLNFCNSSALSQCISMDGTGLSHVGIFNSKLQSQLASSLVVASAIISDSIVDWAKMVCFLDFQATTPPIILKI